MFYKKKSPPLLTRLLVNFVVVFSFHLFITLEKDKNKRKIFLLNWYKDKQKIHLYYYFVLMCILVSINLIHWIFTGIIVCKWRKNLKIENERKNLSKIKKHCVMEKLGLIELIKGHKIKLLHWELGTIISWPYIVIIHTQKWTLEYVCSFFASIFF